jgi:6-pyruvoyltetrahydropterin/6-carboxytetrahydropterin synthase
LYTISKDFAFSASHVLNGLAEGHQCGRLHGHNYLVRVELSGVQLGGTGMLVDYGDLKPFGAYLDEEVDHRHLNDVLNLIGNPTAENMAAWFFSMLYNTVDLPDDVDVAIGVSETPKTWAWFRR